MKRSLILLFNVFFFLSYAVAKKPICDKKSTKAALVVIDMQNYFISRNGHENIDSNVRKVKEILATQLDAIEKAKSYKIPIIFLEYDGDSYGITTSILEDAVMNYDKVIFLKKSTDGMFSDYNSYKGELVDYVKVNKIGKLIITGANGGACVRSSIETSLGGNCTVFAYSKGIADFNFEDFIYPYVGNYKDIKPKCSSCTFKEVSTIDDIVRVMAQNTGSGAKKPASTSNR